LLKKILRSIAIVAGLTFTTAITAAAADLTIQVTNLRSADGDIHFAIYDQPATFPKKSGKLAGKKTPAKLSKVSAVFEGLKPGTYAIAIYHDENTNGKFDQGFLGIPLEGYAFSKDAPVFLGPPSFDEAAVTLKESGAKITIKMDY
jgi:uncharacterized protein (DUF2141 family)